MIENTTLMKKQKLFKLSQKKVKKSLYIKSNVQNSSNIFISKIKISVKAFSFNGFSGTDVHNTSILRQYIFCLFTKQHKGSL